MNTAPYAVRPDPERRRYHPEAEAPTRTPWQRDRDRIVHSAAFRKLQYKTQVFVNHEGDFFRTRLTHSIEVAQIARSIARELKLDEDLTEALALAHDLGHTPFGHAGEEALASGMQPFGGFDHNTQSFRIVTVLERRYAAFDGLNLTWETLEGLVKHNGPVHAPTAYVANYDRSYPLGLATYASAEAQIAAMSDDIAYHSHDLDDGLRAGLFTCDDIVDVPLLGAALAQAQALSPDLPPPKLRHETIRRVINRLCTALVSETSRRIAELAPDCADDIRNAGRPIVAYDDAHAVANREVRTFLDARMYRHWRVNRMTVKAQAVTRCLFDILERDPRLLPPEWAGRAGPQGTAVAAGAVADYIAGMTDRFAVDEHRRLTDLSIPG